MTNPHDKAIEVAAEVLFRESGTQVLWKDAGREAHKIWIDAARAAIAAYERAMWRPIEEAPKDGTPVLVAFHHDVPARVSGFAEKFAVMRWSFGGGEWYYHGPIGMGGFPDVWLTGFRPLPPVPEGE